MTSLATIKQMHIFKGKSADDAWCKASARFGVEGVASHSNSRAGETKELLHTILSVSEPRNRWVASRRPTINPAFALAEVIWIMRGCRDAKFLTFFNSSLPKFVGNGRTYHGAYGHRLRSRFSLDQLDQAYNVLLHNPNSRQVVLQIWSVEDDFPRRSGKPAAKDVPCNVSSLLKVRDGRLMWTQIMRSNDLHRGTPYNFIQFTTLQEVIAGWLGLEMGEYVHVADSLHVYQSDLADHGGYQRLPSVSNTDSLALPKAKSEIAWRNLELFTRTAMNRATGHRKLLEMVDRLDLPTAYQNIARVLGAEAARRKKLARVPDEIMESCSNACLQRAWNNWTLRITKK